VPIGAPRSCSDAEGHADEQRPTQHASGPGRRRCFALFGHAHPEKGGGANPKKEMPRETKRPRSDVLDRKVAGNSQIWSLSREGR
jgi:hypothetical protein